MQKDKFDIVSAKQIISKNRGKIVKKRIFLANPGLKVMSAIDYLVYHCKFSWFKSAFKPKKKNRRSNARRGK